MTRIQTVSLLDSAEDVNLYLPEGLFLVTENRPLCFDANHHHYVMISVHLDDLYGAYTFQYATYDNRPRYHNTSVVNIARQLPAEKLDQYRRDRRPITGIPVKNSELHSVVIDTQETIKKHLRQFDLEERFQVVKPITHNKTMSDRYIFLEDVLPLSKVAYPAEWKEIAVQDPIPQEFTVFADYYEGPNQGEWVIHYAKYGHLFACLTDHHPWASTYQPIARLMFIGDQTGLLPPNWFKRYACNLTAAALQEYCGKLEMSRQICYGDISCNIENYAAELIAHATPKELQGMLNRLHNDAGPRDYAGLAHEVTVVLHQNKRG